MLLIFIMKAHLAQDELSFCAVYDLTANLMNVNRVMLPNDKYRVDGMHET